LQLSAPLHTLPSFEHVTGVPGVHDPLWHESPVVQAFPSLHAVPSVATG
jgi:hypothetical protein